MNRILTKIKISTLGLILILSQPIFAINESTLIEIEGAYKCEFQEERAVVKYHSFVSSNKRITGEMKEGEIAGQVTRSYMGASTFGDIMIVEELEDNLGYNITLSMCPDQGVVFDGTFMISKDREFSNFSTPYGIMLIDNSDSSEMGSLVALNTLLVTKPYETDYETISISELETTFFNAEPSLN